MYSAGAEVFISGPRTLLQVWNVIAETHPTQTQGWSKLLFVWGRIAGWSEPAIRSLPFFAGMLALALVYRSGHDLLSHRGGSHSHATARLLGVLPRLHGAGPRLHARHPLHHINPVELLAPGHPSTSNRPRCQGWPSAWQYWPALFALFWLPVPARTWPVSPAHSSRRIVVGYSLCCLSPLPS